MPSSTDFLKKLRRGLLTLGDGIGDWFTSGGTMMGGGLCFGFVCETTKQFVKCLITFLTN